MVSGMLLKADGTVQLREVRDELEEWYSLLGCRLIEAVNTYVGASRTRFTVICDEEALINGNDTPTVFGREGDAEEQEPILFGNVFICKTSPSGEFESLTIDECTHLMNHLRTVQREDGTGRPVLTFAHRFRTSSDTNQTP